MKKPLVLSDGLSSFQGLITQYSLSRPSMGMRRRILEHLNGYEIRIKLWKSFIIQKTKILHDMHTSFPFACNQSQRRLRRGRQ